MRSGFLRYQIGTLLAIFSICQTNAAVRAQQSPSNANQPTDLAEVIRSSKALSASTKVTASLSGAEVDITAQREPSLTDEKVKEQAVLVAKAVFDVLPLDIQRAKIVLLNANQKENSEVIVKRAEVKLFATGQLSKTELLTSLELTKPNPAGGTQVRVVDGPFQSWRLVILARLNRMRERGQDTSVFQKMFDEDEILASQGKKPQLFKRLSSLAKGIGGQENAANAATHKDRRVPKPKPKPEPESASEPVSEPVSEPEPEKD